MTLTPVAPIIFRKRTFPKQRWMGMPEYRVYLINALGKIDAPATDLTGQTDAEAFMAANSAATPSHSAEVWFADRLVCRVIARNSRRLRFGSVVRNADRSAVAPASASAPSCFPPRATIRNAPSEAILIARPI